MGAFLLLNWPSVASKAFNSSFMGYWAPIYYSCILLCFTLQSCCWREKDSKRSALMDRQQHLNNLAGERMKDEESIEGLGLDRTSKDVLFVHSICEKISFQAQPDSALLHNT